MSNRNSFYDGASSYRVVVNNSSGAVGHDVSIDSAVAAAQLAEENATTSATSASASAAAALTSQNAVNDIIPTGGDDEMILVKNSATDHDLKWTSTLDNTTIDASMNGGYF